MTNLFGILGTGLSGLQAAQQALDVIGQNVANAQTPGYSRERVDLSSVAGTANVGLASGISSNLSGVKVDGVERIKSEFLQSSLDSATATQSALQAQITPLNDVQTLLGEPSDTGIQGSLSTFYAAWATLGNNPTTGNNTGSTTAGALVLTTGQALASQLNQISTGLANEWQNQLTGLTSTVTQANVAAAQVASLNAKIHEGQTGGLDVASLQDQRDRAVTSLATLVGGVAYTDSQGEVSVSIGGVQIVAGNFSTAIKLGGGSDISVATTDPPTLTVGTVQASPSSGTAAGLLASMKTDLPGISAQVDSVANALKTAVNTLQDSGYTLTGDQGEDFFSGTGARDIAVALTSPDQLAVASIPGGAQDGSNALKISELAIDATAAAVLGGVDGPSVQARSLTATIGAQVQGLNTALTGQTAIVTSATNAVASDSGVSLDEELTNLLTFQRSYQASAKIITATDEMLQSLIAMVP
jgi:flagellar hook-associated protein 1 FlgK